MNFFTSVLDILFPPKCVFCHKILEHSVPDGICADCAGQLRIHSEPYSAVNMDSAVSVCYAPMDYDGNVRESLLRFKFGGNSFYADTYAKILCITCGRQMDADLITWVPLSRKRLRKRGYDQAKLIAEAVSVRLGVPCVPVLRKLRNIRAQSSLQDAVQRQRNIRNVYSVSEPEKIRGKRILLIDDIVTTGATLSECARTLREAGAAEVIAAAAAGGRRH